MVNELQSSNLPDPIQGQSRLPIFPRTFRDPKHVFEAKRSDDLEAIDHYMKSMALKSPDKVFEKAKAVLDGNLELVNTNFDSCAALEYKKEAVRAKGKENPQERRPALGRKRARFSLKPETSQPLAPLEPSVDINQLQDPEEYFAAYEKLENTRKELQRQKGSEDLNEVNQSRNDRRRRPGISGKKASYRHHDYSVHSENDISSSQETLQHDIPLATNHDSQQETAILNMDSQEKELAGSIARTENKVNELFDELLSSNIEKLDGDEAVSFVQACLQIKPVDLDDICLPDFHGASKPDFVSLAEKLPKHRKTLTDIDNFLKELNGENPLNQKELLDNPLQPQATHSPPKSPFASISFWGKHISKSRSSNDPFSARNIDSSATSPSVEIVGHQSDHVSKSNELSISSKLKPIARDEVTIATDSEKVSTGDSDNSSNNVVNDHMEDHNQCINMEERVKDDSVIGPNGDTDIQTHEHDATEFGHEKMQVEDTVQKEAFSTQLDVNIEGSIDTDVQPPRLPDIDENVGDVQQKAVSSTVADIDIELPTMENVTNDQSQSDQTNANATEDHASGRPSKTPEIGPEQQHEIGISNQIFEEYHKGHTVNEGRKTRGTRRGDRRKILSHRQSLAEAGTYWKSGVRRSNRVRSKPLEYWKGERFLYGRVHTTLPTVIGRKYISPTKKTGEPTFRVESYVSDNYKDLVELAALH